MTAAVKRAIGAAFLAGAGVSGAAGGWWAWPGLAAVGLYLLAGHVRLGAVGGREKGSGGRESLIKTTPFIDPVDHTRR